MFLDAEKGEYLQYLKLTLPNIRSGGLIVPDDTITMRDEMLNLCLTHFTNFEPPVTEATISTNSTYKYKDNYGQTHLFEK